MAETEVGTATSIEVAVRTDYRFDEGDHERLAHYVRKGSLTEAIVLGTPVVALCGKVWVPSRDPQRFPICPECKRLYELGRDGRDREWRERAEDTGRGGE